MIIKCTLGQIAYARSGDKGNSANVGLIAYQAEGYEFLKENVTASKVLEYFSGLKIDEVKRYELPNLWALNFVLTNALGGGASRSLRLDSQGKALGVALLELNLEIESEQFKRLISKAG